MELFQHSPSVWVREIELRRETVAVMQLRGRLHRAGPLPRTSPQSDPQQSLDASSIDRVMPPIRILSICDYDGLRVARELLLKQEGYSIESHESHDAFDALSGRSFHLAILCHSVAQQYAIPIADILHRYNSHIQVLRLCSADPHGCSSFDRELDSLADPGELLEIIRQTIFRGLRPALRP